MADVFKFVGGLFGVGEDDSEKQRPKPQYIDPDDERKAMAELKDSGILQDADEQHKLPMVGTGSAIGKDGSIDFDQLYKQSGLNREEFTADHALKLITNVEKTIPPVISDPIERNKLLLNVILATMPSESSTSTLVIDAKRKADILKSLIRARLDNTADFKQKSEDKIKSLEQQIAMTRAATDAADQQFSNISSHCQERQAAYTRLTELLTSDVSAPQASDTPPVKSSAN